MKYRPRQLLIIFSILLGISLQIPTTTLGQGEVVPRSSDFRRSSLFLELGGNVLLYSINYDHRFSEHVTGRIGVTLIPSVVTWTGETDPGLIVPLMVNFLAGEGKHHLELGGGMLLGTEVSAVDFNLAPTATIGYRRQPLAGGFLFRIGFTPAFSLSETGFFLPWGGISLGYTFQQK